MAQLTVIQVVQDYEKEHGPGWTILELAEHIWGLQQAGLCEPFFRPSIEEQARQDRCDELHTWVSRVYLYNGAGNPPPADNPGLNYADVGFHPKGRRMIAAWLEQDNSHTHWAYGHVETVARLEEKRRKVLENARIQLTERIPAIVYSQAVLARQMGDDLQQLEQDTVEQVKVAFQEARKVEPLANA